MVSHRPYLAVILSPVSTFIPDLRLKGHFGAPLFFVSASRTRPAREVFGFFVQFAQFSFQNVQNFLLDIHPERWYNYYRKKER